VDFASGITRVTDNDANKEYILIEFNALVNNAGTSAADSNDAGDVLSSNFQLFVDGTANGATCPGPHLTVVEPSITDLAKFVQLSADGSTATYILTFSNAGGPTNSTAYNVRVLDATPAGLTLDPASVTVVGGTGVTNNSTAGQLDVNLAALAPGASV